MNENTTRNKHPKYGNGLGFNRRSNGNKRKRENHKRDLYSYHNPSRCSKLSGVWEHKGRLIWYSYHQKFFRKYSDSVLRNNPELEIPNGAYYRKIFNYSNVCW